jgi:hypothetical protein
VKVGAIPRDQPGKFVDLRPERGKGGPVDGVAPELHFRRADRGSKLPKGF